MTSFIKWRTRVYQSWNLLSHTLVIGVAGTLSAGLSPVFRLNITEISGWLCHHFKFQVFTPTTHRQRSELRAWKNQYGGHVFTSLEIQKRVSSA